MVRAAADIDYNEFIREASLRLCSSLHLDECIENLTDYLKNFMPLQWAAINLINRVEHKSYALCNIGESTLGMNEELLNIENGMLTVNLQPDYIETMDASRQNDIYIINPDNGVMLNQALYRIAALNLTLDLDDEHFLILSLGNDEEILFGAKDAELLAMLKKPLRLAMINILKHKELANLKDRLLDDNRFLLHELQPISATNIIGANMGLREIMQNVRRVAGMPSPVLISGETGSGKEVIANAIHEFSTRRQGPFIKVNCGAIAEHLLESELFGHEKGAFTGAINTKRGRFERADGGTIFLDEIGELTPAAQVSLLRVLQNHEIERVGGSKTIPLDIRVIAATNRNLEEMVRRGDFRDDLWFRLNVFPIHLPPLRERREDIPHLIYHFTNRKAREMNLPVPELRQGSMQHLTDHPWRGNVRELENVVERGLIYHQGGPLDLTKHLNTSPNEDPHDHFPSLDAAMAEHIETAIKRCGGKIKGPGGAAELLKIHPSTLRNRIRKLREQP